MKKKTNAKTQPKPTVARMLERVTDAQLVEVALCSAFRIKTVKKCETRTKNLHRAAKVHGVMLGDGKRCSIHHRCGNLACPICRLRAQLAFMTKWSDVVRPSKQRRAMK